MAASIVVHLEFGGGAELLFGGVRNHQVTLPSQSQPWTVKQLLVWIRANLLKERPELFLQGDTVMGKNKDVCMIQLKDINVHLRSMFHIARPGILVLINDADWELMGELKYLLQDQDNVIFISTLHGG